MKSDGLIAEIEKRFGLAGIELSIAAARSDSVDATTPLARDVAAFLQQRGRGSLEMRNALDVLLALQEGRP
jgi:hypothetical protein